ncbi:MAG TPA: hypothetical protein VG370_34105 [Chloroflexota bacterium]|jgi:hypothetical protein|nr:hypothetical protein [Chloroflexota bacterium]
MAQVTARRPSSDRALRRRAADELPTEERRREAFAAAMTDMGRDPDVLRESAAIAELFRPADADGLP